MGKMKILISGNLLVEEDNLAMKILPELKKRFPDIVFREFDPNENLEDLEGNITILDVAKGIDEVRLIKGLDKIEASEIYSLHDFDLGFNLKLLKKIGRLDKIRIIAIPYNISEKQALNQVQLILRKLVAQLMQGS